MVPVGSDPSSVVLERLRALPAGARLLDALDGVDGVWLVGGAVRDLLTGRAPHELDLATAAPPTPTARLLAARLGGEARHHDAFGTATIAGPDGLSLDLAQARTETYARPGALPDVAPAASMEADLARRDFTVNAIAVGLSADVAGRVVSAAGALEDLAGEVLRVLHAWSFVDDPTRLLRLVRYAARLGFAIEPETERLARAAFASGAPATAGPARMGRELLLLLREPDPVAGLVLLRALGGAGELAVDEDVLRRVVALTPDGHDPAAALLAALSVRMEPAARRTWLEGMHVPAPGPVLDAAAAPAELARALRGASRYDLHRLMRRRPVEALVLAAAVDPAAEEAARRWLDDVRHVRLDITGADLLRAGVPQGREVGERLDAALRAKLDGTAATREEQLAVALHDGFAEASA